MGGVLAIVGAALPWWNLSAGVGGYISVTVPVLGIFLLGGILALVFGVLGIVFSTLKHPAMGFVILIMGLLTIVASVAFGVMLPVASVTAGTGYASATAGFGYWISLIGGVLLLVAGPLLYTDNKKSYAQPVPAMPPTA